MFLVGHTSSHWTRERVVDTLVFELFYSVLTCRTHTQRQMGWVWVWCFCLVDLQFVIGLFENEVLTSSGDFLPATIDQCSDSPFIFITKWWTSQLHKPPLLSAHFISALHKCFFRHPERSGLTLSQADEEKEEKADEKEETEDCDGSYPLVNLQKTTENHNFL